MARVGLLPFSRGIACVVLVGGCASIAGLNEPAEQTDQDVKAPPPTPTGDPSQAPPRECTPKVEAAFTDGVFHAPAWTEGKEPAIDGDVKDWSCVTRHELGPGVWTTSKFPAEAGASIAFRWTPQYLYFFASVETTTPGGQNAEGFQNDSINVYLGPPNPAAQYRPEDHQFSFDHEGKISHYNSGRRAPLPPTILHGMRPTTRDGKLVFEVEARIEAKLFNLPSFTKGQRLTLGLQLHDRLEGSIEWRTWFRSATCGCTTGCCEPANGNKNLIACDLRCTGELVLD